MVFDASALYAAVVDPSSEAGRALSRGDTIQSPELFVIEVANSIRANRIRGQISAQAGRKLLRELQRLPVVRHPMLLLLDRIWALQENLTAYDAAYVALAEQLEEPLVTADARLARAPGIRCEVEVVRL